MVYLIGGCPRVGKSIMAKKFADKLKAKQVSTDMLAEKFESDLQEVERVEKFPFPGFSGNPEENKFGPQELVQFQLVEARSLETELRRIIIQALFEGEACIIEGVHLLPESVRGLIDEFGAEKIRAVFVGSVDAGRIAEGIEKNSSPKNWMRGSSPAVIRQVADFSAVFSEWLKKECDKSRLKYVERTDDFESDVAAAVDMLKK